MPKTFLITCLYLISFSSLSAKSRRLVIHPNLGFELNSLKGWSHSGTAFKKQPIKGNTVRERKATESSEHYEKFWIGGYEKFGDNPVGTLTSTPFTVSSRYASFLIGGGQDKKHSCRNRFI